MTTDTKPSEKALEIARELDEFYTAVVATNEWPDINAVADVIDAGVREMREALEAADRFISDALDSGSLDWTKAYVVETALRAWRNK